MLSFSGWRLSIVYKMKEVNLFNLPNKRNFNKAKVGHVTVEKKEKKSTRPTISFNKSNKDSHSLRFLDGPA